MRHLVGRHAVRARLLRMNAAGSYHAAGAPKTRRTSTPQAENRRKAAS